MTGAILRPTPRPSVSVAPPLSHSDGRFPSTLNNRFLLANPTPRRFAACLAASSPSPSGENFFGGLGSQPTSVDCEEPDDGLCDAVPSDPSTLPKPLRSAGFPDSTSKGSRLRVAYQGVTGAYSELAAEAAYPNCEPVPCEHFDTAFEAVERWLVDRAVLPIENSLGGSIHRNYDLLLRHRLHIVGEVNLVIRHCLLANQGVKIEDLERVVSHPQALAQCEHTLARFGLVREAVNDTAGAAKFVASRKFKHIGAVASVSAARNYGLNILVEDIQDDSDNVTRFLMLAREPIMPGTDRPYKTSIVFSLKEGPGALFKALAVFSLRDINLSKIESRPLQMRSNGPSKRFHAVFYLDFEASVADKNAQYALRHLETLHHPISHAKSRGLLGHNLRIQGGTRGLLILKSARTYPRRNFDLFGSSGKSIGMAVQW